MSRLERVNVAASASAPVFLGACVSALLSALSPGPTLAAEPATFRYRAPIEIRAPAPFVQLALTPDAYAHAERADLADLRVIDARGERTPFAMLPPRSALRESEQAREALLYPLPARPSAAGVWPSPVEVVVEGDRISVNRRTPAATLGAKAPVERESGGWLIDTGEARAGDPAARSLRLRWSGPAEFSAAYSIETSGDLRGWRAAGSGQLMALQSATGSVTQPIVTLPDSAGRFVRLVWADAAAAPVVTGASALIPERQTIALDSARELVFAAADEPAGRAGGDAEARGSLHFDLGAALPIVGVDLRFTTGTHVAPVRIQGRMRSDQPWRELGAGVFYRLERGSVVGQSPAVALPATVRFLRVLVDPRAAALDKAQSQLVVHAALASLVFAAQGQPPFALLAGSRDAPSGALPSATLIPQLDDERPRFGRAELGAFSVVEAADRAARQADRQATLRPWLLWSVLVIGVAALAALVWRLARTSQTSDKPSSV